MERKDEAKRHVLTMRITPRMRDDVERAASLSGRSISQEVELRLEHSFMADAGLGGEEQSTLLRELASVMDHASAVLGQPWHSEHVGWELVNDALAFLMRAAEPPRSPPLSDLISSQGQAAIDQWKHTVTQQEEELLQRLRERDQLEIKEATLGRLDEREERRLQYLRTLKASNGNLAPRLAGKDAQHWADAEEARVKGNRMFERVEPILRQAMERARKSPAMMKKKEVR